MTRRTVIYKIVPERVENRISGCTHPASCFPFEDDVWPLLVEADPNSIQFNL